jgi:hypothetical protein
MAPFRNTWLRTLFLVAMTAAWSAKALEASLPEPCQERASYQGVTSIGADTPSQNGSLPADGHDRHACHCTHTHLSGIPSNAAPAAVAAPKSHPTVSSVSSYRSRRLSPPVPPPLF